MKALFVSNDPKLFDANSAVRARHREYARAIGELHVLSRAAPAAREEQEGELYLHPVTAVKPWHLFALENRARALIRAHEIEIVSAQDPFEHGLIALLAARGTSARLHMQIHTDFLSPYFGSESLKNYLRVKIADSVLPRACGIRVVSERIKRSLTARYGDRITIPAVIPIRSDKAPGVTLPLPPHAFSFTLLTASRLEPEKRIEDILEAVAEVRKEHEGLGLYIAGEGSERTALWARARALGLGDAAVFLGWRDDVSELMEKTDAFIQASAYEGYGLSLAMAGEKGCSIITSDVGIVGDVLMPEESALVCPVGDVACYARGIRRLISDPQSRAALGAGARAAVARHLAQQSNQPQRIAEDLKKL